MGLPRKAVSVAAVAILVMALLGVYFGVRRSLPGDDLESIPVQLGSNAKVANAQALTEPLTLPLDEERVRVIAREEAQALIAPRAPRRTEPEGGEVLPPTTVAPAPAPVAPTLPAAPAVTPLSPDLR
jgi:hypothetical protein